MNFPLGGAKPFFWYPCALGFLFNISCIFVLFWTSVYWLVFIFPLGKIHCGIWHDHHTVCVGHYITIFWCNIHAYLHYISIIMIVRFLLGNWGLENVFLGLIYFPIFLFGLIYPFSTWTFLFYMSFYFLLFLSLFQYFIFLFLSF